MFTRLTLPQATALIDAWPCPFRIARDLACPSCGLPELGQTVQSGLPELLYCRRCGWTQTGAEEPLPGMRKPPAWSSKPGLEALAILAVALLLLFNK